jgi:hypothetical protein
MEIDKSNKDNEEEKGTLTDRYYRAMYEVLHKTHLNKATKLDEFFSLVFKSMK